MDHNVSIFGLDSKEFGTLTLLDWDSRFSINVFASEKIKYNLEEAGKIRQALKNSDQNTVFKGYKNKDFRNLNPTKMLITITVGV